MTLYEKIKTSMGMVGIVAALYFPTISHAESFFPSSLVQKVGGRECLETNRVEYLSVMQRPRENSEQDPIIQKENFNRRYLQDPTDLLKSALKAKGYNPVVGEYSSVKDIFFWRTYNNNPLVVFFSLTSSSPSWGDYFQVAVYDKKMNLLYQSCKADCLYFLVHQPHKTLTDLIPPSCEQIRRQEHKLMEWQESIPLKK